MGLALHSVAAPATYGSRAPVKASLAFRAALATALCLIAIAWQAVVTVPAAWSAQAYTKVREFGATQLQDPKAITASGSNIFVADGGTNRVYVFSATGSLVNSWGGTGTDDAQFTDLTGITTNQAGEVFTVESGEEVWQDSASNRSSVLYTTDGRIQRFTSGGAHVASIAPPQKAWLPSKIGADSKGNLYLINNQNGEPDPGYMTVTKYSLSTGSAVNFEGHVCDYSCEFMHLRALAVDPLDRIYTAGPDGHVSRFDSAGVRQLMFHPGQGRNPYGLDADGAGNIYAINGAGVAQKINSMGGVLAEWAALGTQLTVANSGHVYIAVGDKIREYAPIPAQTPSISARYSTVNYGGWQKISGLIKTASGQPLGSARLSIQRRNSNGTWTTVASDLSDSTGYYQSWFTVESGSTSYRALYNATNVKASSGIGTIVKPGIAIWNPYPSVPKGAWTKIHGKIAWGSGTGMAGKYVELQRWNGSTQRWRKVASTTSWSTGYYRFWLKLYSTGSYRTVAWSGQLRSPTIKKTIDDGVCCD